ncbi:MAG: beta-ketoacyl-ACP synthase II [Oscillospiraceae bacterium]|nr:beta-ketoacyl-ACP synthase II [Oscillospiraceae bacterium]
MKRVVVTGIGALTPIGNSVAEFTEALRNGKNGIGKIKAYDATDSKYTLAAELKNFDPLTRLEKTTVRKNDLFVQYALYSADEAIEDSGILGKISPDRLGVYYGSGIGGFNTLCSEHQAFLEGGPRKVTPQFIPKMIINMAAGSIAIRYHANNGCISVCTACASSTSAIGEAYRAITGGYADAIICGGTEAAINPLTVAGFGNCMALTDAADPSAASLPFDRRRAGFVLGEGAGTLILEEYEHAVSRNAKIYAEIFGYGSTCDAYHITAPRPEGTESMRAIRDSLSGSDGGDCSKIYVNAHGTGTPLNDKTETLALKLAFGEEAKRLHISSTKSMTGHMLGAAGGVEAIAAICALRDEIIPPTINLFEPDESCDLDYTPNTAQHAKLDIALSVSLGFGGHNACVAFKKTEG